MPLREQLQKDMTDALKAGDQAKRITLGMVVNAIKQKELIVRGQLSKTITDPAELQIQSQLNDAGIIDVIASEVKKRRESIEQFKAGNRQDLADKEESEIKILAAYLPEQLSEDAVRTEVRNAIAALGATDIKEMGKVIKAAMEPLKGRADGSVVSRIVKEELSK
jgi:uncharacterized protein